MNVLPLVDHLIEFLRDDESGAERYAFGEGAAALLEDGLDVLFELIPDPEPTLNELVKLSCALEVEMRSPSAAALVRAVLYADPRVLAVFAPKDEAAAPRPVMRAPMFGVAAAPGTIKAGALAKGRSPARTR